MEKEKIKREFDPELTKAAFMLMRSLEEELRNEKNLGHKILADLDEKFISKEGVPSREKAQQEMFAQVSFLKVQLFEKNIEELQTQIETQIFNW